MKPAAKTPCHRCPKYLLYPPGYGLRPENQLAVHIFRMACDTDRAGMEGVLVFKTPSVEAINATMEHYRDFMPTKYDRRITFEKVRMLCQIINDRNAQEESKERERLRLQHKSETPHRRRKR